MHYFIYIYIGRGKFGKENTRSAVSLISYAYRDYVNREIGRSIDRHKKRKNKLKERKSHIHKTYYKCDVCVCVCLCVRVRVCVRARLCVCGM